VVGVLESFCRDAARIGVRDRESGDQLEVPLAQISQARLEVDL
jgi:hypothetical protein